MRWPDWIIVAVYLVWVVTSGLRVAKRANELDGYFRANRSAAVVGCGPVGDGDASERDHARRHDRPGLRRRHPLRPVLLRAADRDDHPLGHARAVLLPVGRLHRVRISRAAI